MKVNAEEIQRRRRIALVESVVTDAIYGLDLDKITAKELVSWLANVTAKWARFASVPDETTEDEKLLTESHTEMIARVRNMADGHRAWDLSPNDLAALRYVLRLVDESNETIQLERDLSHHRWLETMRLQRQVDELEARIRVDSRSEPR